LTSTVEGVLGWLPGTVGVHTPYAKRFSISAGESFLDYEPIVGQNWTSKKERIPNTGPFKCSCGEMHMDGDPAIGTLLGDPKTEPAARFTELRIEQAKKIGATKASGKGVAATYQQVVDEFAL